MNALATLTDTDLAALEESIQVERRQRDYIARYQQYPPHLDTIRDAAQMASEWLEPAYMHSGTGFGGTIHMCAPNKETGYRGVVYPDGRIVFCGYVPSAKVRKTLASISAECGANALARARECLSECVEEYLWHHGTRMGRRYTVYEWTPGGYPWGDKRWMPQRIWREWGTLRPRIRRQFFAMDREGAYCTLEPNWTGLPNAYVFLASENPPPMPKAAKPKRKTRKAAQS